MRIRIVDAFTDRAFAGNPAGVCLLDAGDWPDAGWMLSVAAELNLPMTAFGRPLEPGGEADWGLRWFMPRKEERLCGHATLAIAHALHADRGAPGTVRFDTLAGVLTTHTTADGAITLDFPAAPIREVPVSAGYAEALGVAPRPSWTPARCATAS